MHLMGALMLQAKNTCYLGFNFGTFLPDLFGRLICLYVRSWEVVLQVDSDQRK